MDDLHVANNTTYLCAPTKDHCPGEGTSRQARNSCRHCWLFVLRLSFRLSRLYRHSSAHRRWVGAILSCGISVVLGREDNTSLLLSSLIQILAAVSTKRKNVSLVLLNSVYINRTSIFFNVMIKATAYYNYPWSKPLQENTKMQRWSKSQCKVCT